MLYHFPIDKALSSTCIQFFFLMIEVFLTWVFSALLLAEHRVRNSPAIIVLLYWTNLRLWKSQWSPPLLFSLGILSLSGVTGCVSRRR